jgi:hypothetical protein
MKRRKHMKHDRNKMRRRIFGCKRDKAERIGRKLNYEELRNFLSSPDIMRARHSIVG